MTKERYIKNVGTYLPASSNGLASSVFLQTYASYLAGVKPEDTQGVENEGHNLITCGHC